MKHYEKRRSVSGRLFVLMLALVLVLGCAVGGTVAWLVAKTDPVVNTFTYGDINITLTETTGENYKIIPGVDIGKDPKVTVKADSEACWLFVKVEEEGTFVANKVTYSVADGWTKPACRHRYRKRPLSGAGDADGKDHSRLHAGERGESGHQHCH